MGLEDLRGREQMKDFNKEIREEIKNSYAEFQDLYGEIIGRIERNPGIRLDGKVLDSQGVVDRFASELHQIKRILDTYPENVPNEEVQNILSINQRVMNKAQGFYHGEYNLLDKDGNWLENPEHLKN